MVRFGKRKSFRRRWKKFKRGRKPTKKLFKRVRRIEKGIETKRIDSQVNNAISSGGSAFALNYQCTQGTGDKNRIGSRIMCTSIDLRLNMSAPLALGTGDNHDRVRLMLLWDKLPQGSGIPAISDVLESTAVNYVTANRNWVTRKGYRMIWDKVFTLYAPQSGGVLTGTEHVVTIRKHFKLNKQTDFNANAGAAADIERNLLVLMLVSDSTAVDHPQVYGDIRVKFQDP